MSENKTDSGVIELDADWDNVPQESLSDSPADTTEPSGDAQERVKLKIGIVGDNYLAQATRASFDPKLADVHMGGIDDVLKCNVIFVCIDLEFLKNDTVNDVELIDLMNKIQKGSDAGVCIKTTIGPETLDRIAMATDVQWFIKKVIYSPEIGETAEEVLTNNYIMIGGDEETRKSHANIILNMSATGQGIFVEGTPHEICYAKLAMVGFKAAKQTFFNQMHQTIPDCEGANPTTVRRIVEQSPVMSDLSFCIPTFTRALLDPECTTKQARAYSGEFANRDIRLLVGMTDRLTILDECYNVRNLK